MPGGGDARRGVDGRTEIALRPFLGLAGVDPDPQTQLDTPGPGFGGHLQLQLAGPRGGVIGSVERRPERLAAGGEQVPALPVHRRPHQLDRAGTHRRGHLLPVRRPQPRASPRPRRSRTSPSPSAELTVESAEVSGRAAARPGPGSATPAPQPGTGFHPELFHQLVSRPAERLERVGLPTHPVQRGHQQRPQVSPGRDSPP